MVIFYSVLSKCLLACAPNENIPKRTDMHQNIWLKPILMIMHLFDVFLLAFSLLLLCHIASGCSVFVYLGHCIVCGTVSSVLILFKCS